MSRRWRGLWCGLGLVAAAVGLLMLRGLARSPEQTLRAAQSALKGHSFSQAAALAEDVLRGRPDSVEAHTIAAEAYMRMGRHEDALRHYLAMPDDGSEASIKASFWAGELLFQFGEASRAEECFRRVLKHHPHDLWAHEELAKLLDLFGQRWESVPHLLESIRQQQFTVEQLLYLGETESVLAPPADLEKFQQRAPADPLPYVTLARNALERARKPDEARRLAEEALARDPNQVEAWAVLGRALLESNPEELATWNAKLPSAAEAHPDVWLVRGLWSEQLNQPRAAARCLWEAVRRAPNYRAANHHLGRALVALGEADKAQPFLDRAARLQELRSVLDLLYQIFLLQHHETADAKTASMLRQAAELTEAQGRLWEAWGWCRFALTLDANLSWARAGLLRLEPRLSPGLPQTLPEACPAEQVDLSTYPLPHPTAVTEPSVAGPVARSAEIRFAESAASAGIDFQYRNGFDPPAGTKLLGPIMGGGVAVLDYDHDGWPDLYFPQGGDWPPREDSQDQDRCYRHLGTERFADVTESSRLGDRGYSQGATVGDYDNDGFPDLYVANLGRNRLYRNNGDGTYSDVTDQAGIVDQRWTTSCVMVDLNGDSWPDLYDVNYLAGEDVHHAICHSEGKPRSCAPALFPGEQDCFLLNQGDGTFRDETAAAGFAVPNGKGLGVVAADLTRSGRLDLFIANDSVPNFYFVNETPSPGDRPQFREAAGLAGLAFDSEGRALGSMGIAIDDMDGDGRLDLFVTNYVEEFNSFYQQQPGGYFEDIIRRSGLAETSFRLVGFGTQFLDADLDGLPDLVVTNGHIGDYTDKGYLYHMPPQFFRNSGEGRFAELDAATLGPYFQGKYLGRGLARLDWNRDGREDFVVGHLDSPPALLTNQTTSAGHSLTLRFVATRGSRDAIGTTVTLTAGGRTRVRQLTAGDGYLASNERALVFGLGEQTSAESISVRWPSGATTRLDNIPADQVLLLIEGRTVPIMQGATGSAIPADGRPQ